MRTVIALSLAIVVGLLGSIACADDAGSVAATANERGLQEATPTEDQENVLDVPVLDDPRLIANGAAEYAVMCSDCHLGPGLATTNFAEP